MLDLVRYVRDDLDCLPEILPLALTIQDVPVDLAAREIRVAGQILVGEPLIMPKVEVCLRAVIRHEDLPMLKGTHRPGIHVHVRIEFLAGDAKTAHFQKSAQRCRRDSFTETGDDASGHKYIFRHTAFLLSDCLTIRM